MRRMTRWDILRRCWRIHVSTTSFEIQTPVFAIQIADFSEDYCRCVLWKGWRIGWGVGWWHEPNGILEGSILYGNVRERILEERYQ